MSGNAKARKRKGISSWFIKGGYFDYSMLFVVMFIVCFGLVMIYSTSSYKANLELGDPAYFLKKQGIIAVLSFFVMYIVSKIDYHIYQKFTVLIYLSAFILQVAVLFTEGVKGAKRWIDLPGGLKFQPSEYSKIAMILFMAYMVTLTVNKIHKMGNMLKIMALSLPIFVLVAKENMSTSIVILAIAAIIVFVASPKYKQFIVLAMGAIGLLTVVLLAASYRMERIAVWLHPEEHAKGYQTMQALYAIGSGGLFGKGLGQSMQKMGFIPESHNDMIFSVICEELGLFGAICVIAMFMILIWRLMIIASNAPDLYGALIVVGVLAHIGIQVIINIAVVTNTIPPTGIPLPLISYGGTSMLFILVEMGMALSVSRQIKMDR